MFSQLECLKTILKEIILHLPTGPWYRYRVISNMFRNEVILE